MFVNVDSKFQTNITTKIRVDCNFFYFFTFTFSISENLELQLLNAPKILQGLSGNGSTCIFLGANVVEIKAHDKSFLQLPRLRPESKIGKIQNCQKIKFIGNITFRKSNLLGKCFSRNRINREHFFFRESIF